MSATMFDQFDQLIREGKSEDVAAAEVAHSQGHYGVEAVMDFKMKLKRNRIDPAVRAEAEAAGSALTNPTPSTQGSVAGVCATISRRQAAAAARG